MRRLIPPAALLLALSTAGIAEASPGLPVLANLEAGSIHATLLNDSPSLQSGANTLTVAVADLPAGHPVQLKLLGPGGQTIEVPLQPLTVLTGPDGGHGGDSHGSEDDHGGESEGHGDSHGGESDHSEPSFSLRGKVHLPSSGTWTAVLSITDEHGQVQTTQFDLKAAPGGPNRIYLAFTGLVMSGSLIYGAVGRRRNQHGGRA